MKRINLLSEAEIKDLYSRPEFNSDEQKLYFTLDKSESKLIERYTNHRTWIYFVLQLGYFKAKQQFFSFKFKDVVDDVKYIIKTFADGINFRFS